jgi:ubiquinone/menaquinone biosynthesis C-methylase UbiE
MTKRADFGGFGDVAVAFNEQQDSGSYHSPWIFEWLKELIGKPAHTAQLLDLGCGTGTITRYLAQAGFDLVIGVDPDPRMIAVAESVTKGTPYLSVLTDDMPFPDAKFDAVFTHYAFEHFCHDPASIAEIKRVLCDNGVFMTVTWPIIGWNKTRNDVIRPFADDKRTHPPLQHLREVGYADLLRKLGFKNVETKRRNAIIRYTIEQARQYMRGSSLLSCVPDSRLPDAYRALDELCEREADSNGIVSRELEVIVDIGRR